MIQKASSCPGQSCSCAVDIAQHIWSEAFFYYRHCCYGVFISYLWLAQSESTQFVSIFAHCDDLFLCWNVIACVSVLKSINRDSSSKGRLTHLTDIDRNILKLLLTPGDKYSSKALAKKLELPPSTVQRRRKRLEKEFLKVVYSLDLEKFGWHKVDFLIATESGKTDMIAKALLKREEVIYVGKSIGQHTIDLRVETVLENNAEILRMMELLKATSGIKEVMWTEIVEVIGAKTSIPVQIIDKL